MSRETYREYSQRMAQEYAQRLLEKPVATPEELAMYRPIDSGRAEIHLGDAHFKRLDREDERDGLDATERIVADADNPFWDEQAGIPEGFGTLPPVVDHRPNQTPIRDQKDRGTCVCFASLAALEALIKVQQGREIDLSEQFANWLFMAGQHGNQCDDGLRATLAARYLAVGGVCEERDFPYEDRVTVRARCNVPPPPEALANAKFGIGESAIIAGLGLHGPSIGNTDYLESVLNGGHDSRKARDIVCGIQVAWGLPDDNMVFDVIRDNFGNANQSVGGHAMLIVGYDKTGPKPFFIMKNSWGTEVAGKPVGKDGYYFLSYDYVRKYAKYGFVIQRVRTDMPIR